MFKINCNTVARSDNQWADIFERLGDIFFFQKHPKFSGNLNSVKF